MTLCLLLFGLLDGALLFYVCVDGWLDERMDECTHMHTHILLTLNIQNKLSKCVQQRFKK